MNPSDRPRPDLPAGLGAMRLPRITVTREQSAAGRQGFVIDAFGIDTVEKLIEAFETRERELKGS